MGAKRFFLASCSTVAVCCSTIASAQQLVPDATARSTPPSDQTSVPANSDQADETRATKNALDQKPAESDVNHGEDIPNGPEIRHKNAKAPDDATQDITVTGSRLRDGNQTTKLIVITAEDIRNRGVTSVEDLVRTLPQNLATIGTITNNRTKGPLYDSRGRATVSSVGALGVSAANLGGVGAGNTLVLVNGRRLAGAAGIEAGYVNLNGIPLAAIERVEISTGGEAAIYGADALGGVINFILKNNYSGTTLTAQRLVSSGGANVTRLSGYTGRTWSSGNISATVEYSRRDPIENAKTGYVTNNYAPYFGGNPVYDRRSFSSGLQPGVIDRPAVYDPNTGELLQPETGLTLPAGFNGRPGVGDFVTVGLNNARDYVSKYNGPTVSSISGTLNFEQKLTGRLSVFATGLINRTKNVQEDTSFNNGNNGLQVTLAPGQYYNPFAAYAIDPYSPGTTVTYYPGAELADGTLKPGRITNIMTSWSINAGIKYDLSPSTRVQLIYTASSSRTTGSDQQLNNIVSLSSDPTSPNGVACTNFLLDNGLVPAKQRAAYKAAFDRQCLALTSSDPNVAFNPFKSTSAGGGSSIQDFLYVPLQDDLGSVLHNIEGRVAGRAFKLPAGWINYAVGGEYVHSSIQNSIVSTITGSPPTPDRYAVFGEMTVPIFGNGVDIPLVRRLLLNAALRRDVSSVTGAVGTVNGVPVEQGGQLIFATNRFSRTTPSAGVLWSPTSTIDLRVRFTTGFKAPPPTQLFSAGGSIVYRSAIVNDPGYTCTTDCLPYYQVPAYAVPSRIAPNPDLKPETSVQWVYGASWTPTGPLAGLNLAVTYNRNRINNEFADLQVLASLLPAAQAYLLPQFYPRDANGKIIEQRNIKFNVLGSRFESLTVDASYLFFTRIGSFQPKFTGVFNLTADRIGLNDSQVVHMVGTILGPDRYRLVGSLQWNYNNVSANLFVNHTPSYRNDYFTFLNAGRVVNPELVTPVSPLTTVDLSVSWTISKRFNLLFAGRNILKAKAPFTVVDTLPYDTARYDVAGRTLSLQAQASF